MVAAEASYVEVSFGAYDYDRNRYLDVFVDAEVNGSAAEGNRRME